MRKRASRRVGGAALVLAVLAVPLATPLVPSAGTAAAAPRRPLQIGGTWDATWRNSSGEARRGVIVVEQRGEQLSARVESQGNATATGTLTGSTFTLRGSRLGVPFAINGRVNGRRMAGTLTAMFSERRFTATRRRPR